MRSVVVSAALLALVGCGSTSPDGIRADLVLDGSPPAAPRTFVTAALTNRGTETFLIGGCRDVLVQALSPSAGWVSPELICADVLRFTPLRPGDTTRLTVEAPLVRGPGTYRLRVALFAEGPQGVGIPHGFVATRFALP